VAQRRNGVIRTGTDPAESSRLCRKALDASVAFVEIHGAECMATRALRPPSILLVSNSIGERKVYARSLRAWGYRVVNVPTTVLAYQVATTRPTDMVVTDGHCPGSMTGLELTRRLRIHTRTTTVPIIVLTSVTRRQDGDLSIKAGADMFLERPVSSDVLREHVARLLVASGRLSRYSPPLDLLNFTRKAANRPRPQTTSSFQDGSPASAVPVSRSTGDGEGSVSRSAQAADYRTCPQCRGLLEYRQKSPVLSVTEPNDRQPRERLRYVSGWFCNNAACEYRDLAG
jgi:CheY-like chemotaxis protein